MTRLIDLTKPRPSLRHPEKAHRLDQPVARKPPWIRVRAPGSPVFAETMSLVREFKLTTVCEEARCPNIGECWDKRHATFMIMGDTCTRACAFCNVRTGLPNALDQDEPARVADARRFVRVEGRGQAGRDIAEGAGASAGFAHDHKGGVPLVPALADIGTVCLLADRGELQTTHELARLGIDRRPGRLHANPRRLAGDRLIRSMSLLGMARTG